MIDKIVKTAVDLIKFPSVHKRPRDRRACADYIEKFFRDRGLACEVWEPGDVRSLVVRTGSSEPVLCLNGHYDVVESIASDFRPRQEADRLYGRGSADMKTSLAAMMVLCAELNKRENPPPVALMISGDEEMGGHKSTAHILKSGFKCEFAIAGEPTGLAVANQSKGMLGIELEARGTAGHSARPWEGENAIFSFFQQFPAVWEVFGDPEPYEWQTTMAPTVLSAGESVNRIPDRCKCRLDIRFVPMDRPEEILERIKNAAPELNPRVVEEGKAFFTEPEDPHLKRLRQAATSVLKYDPGFINKHASSDARHFTEHGIPAAVFGPGGENIHGTGEWVDLRQVEKFYRVLEEFISLICNPASR
ncbi:MAG: M20/M25/M40 family metallo-hydrolase [bacterium]